MTNYLTVFYPFLPPSAAVGRVWLSAPELGFRSFFYSKSVSQSPCFVSLVFFVVN